LKDKELKPSSLLATGFVTCFLISGLVSTQSITRSISYMSREAIAQPMLTTSSLSPVSSHNTSSTINDSLLTYQNKGMMIKYPFNWKTLAADDEALIFLPPSNKDKFSEYLIVVLFDINNSVSASQLSGQAIKDYGEYYRDFFIIELKPITFQGDPAYVLSYMYTNPVAGKIVAMDIGIKHHNKVYVISYSAEQPEYHTYISTIEKMIQSFHIM